MMCLPLVAESQGNRITSDGDVGPEYSPPQVLLELPLFTIIRILSTCSANLRKYILTGFFINYICHILDIELNVYYNIVS